MIEQYLRAQGLFRSTDGTDPDPEYTGDVMELDLSKLTASVAGPKRPHDLVALSTMPKDFADCL